MNITNTYQNYFKIAKKLRYIDALVTKCDTIKKRYEKRKVIMEKK